jgi:hypothetical protein
MSVVLLIRTKVLSKTWSGADKNIKMNVMIKQWQQASMLRILNPDMLDSKDLISHG